MTKFIMLDNLIFQASIYAMYKRVACDDETSKLFHVIAVSEYNCI